MKVTIKICILIILVIAPLFQGCTKSDTDDFSRVSKMLSEIDTYTATAEIIVKGNKMIGSYMVKQYFMYPDKYRLETISPEDKNGKITAYGGDKLWIYHPQIKQLYYMENFKEVEESTMFPGYFAKCLFSSEEASFGESQGDSKKYVTIKVTVPGGNNYRKYQILYVDKEKLVPVKMEVLDSNENITVTVHYKDFLYNIPIDEKLFRVESIEGLN